MKKNRRVELDHILLSYFENFFTMKAQIQEMLYIEKGGDEQLRDELEAYNPLIPNGSELVATFMFEIDNPLTRKKVLSSLGNVEYKTYIKVNGNKIFAVPENDVDRTDNSGKHHQFIFCILSLRIIMLEILKIWIALLRLEPTTNNIHIFQYLLMR